MMDIDYHWSKSIIGSFCVRSYRRIWAHTMTYGAPLLPRRVFFSLKGTNIYWRGYIYLWLCTYTLMNVLSIGNIFYMCTSIIVCSLSWYFIMKGYITIFTFFFSLCLFLNLFVFIPVSYFLAYSLRACCSRYCIFRLFTWGRWCSANYWLILLHAGFPFFIYSRLHLRAISFRLLSHSFSVFLFVWYLYF